MRHGNFKREGLQAVGHIQGMEILDQRLLHPLTPVDRMRGIQNALPRHLALEYFFVVARLSEG